jgi:hypothetical protein
MKRSTIALAVCMGLCACSGQRNENVTTLGAGKRDAAVDADQPEDDEDAGTDLEDAADPEPDAGANGDADMQAGDAAGAEGDAGGNPNQLRIRLVYETQSVTQASILFSYADGGVASMHATDSDGVLVSDTAPAMFTAVLPSSGSDLNELYDVVTVVAPALGDYIVLDALSPRRAADQAIRYRATVGSVPAGGYGVYAYAGVDGCAQGYQDLVPAPTSPMEIGQRPDCQLESNGALIAVMYDEPGAVLRFAGAALPAAGDSPVSFTLDQWLVPEDLTLRLANGVSNAAPETYLWMRKGALKVRVNNPDSPLPTALPFKVARSIVDSFDATGWFERTASASQHLFGKNRPASVEDVTLDLNEALPELDRDMLSTTYLPPLRPSASWGVQGGTTPADAVVAVFTWNWQPNADTTASLTWRFVAPPDTTSVTVPETPSTGSFGLGGLVPAEADVRFGGVEYYDSDAQSGYREFLEEPLRPGATASVSGSRTGDLVRDIPLGGNTRMGRFRNLLP